MRHLFIINPAAGKKGTTAQLETLLKELSFPHEVVYTEREGDARRSTARQAMPTQPLPMFQRGQETTF